jgi:hypothetical protein
MRFLLMVLASAFLVACGGGGSDTVTGGGGDGSTDLVAVYDKVTAGMNYEQVKALVGYAHNGGESLGASVNSYTWNSGTVGTSSQQRMTVMFNANGGTTYRKQVVTATGVGRSQSF